jgi:hypothetical protein
MTDYVPVEEYQAAAEKGKLSPLFRQPEYLQRPSRYLSYIPGQDPAYTQGRVDDLTRLGEYGNDQADVYGDLITTEADAALSTGREAAAVASSLGQTGNASLGNAGRVSQGIGQAGAETLGITADESYASGVGAANDLTRRTAGAYDDIVAPEWIRGVDNAEQQVLFNGRDRSLSAQRALAGTVRGLGGAQNTAMEDALITGEAARNSDLLAAEQERAWQARLLEASKAYGDVTLTGNTAAANARQNAINTQTAGYGQAADVSAQGTRQQTDAFAKGASTGMQGYSDAAGALTSSGNTAMSASTSATGVQDRGRDSLLKSDAGIIAARDLEQRGGMASEDYLTDAYASALGQISASSAIQQQREAAIVKGSADAGATFLSGLDDEDER